MPSHTALNETELICALDQQRVEESCSADEENDSWDIQIKEDFEAGRLDAAIAQALADERNGRIRPL